MAEYKTNRTECILGLYVFFVYVYVFWGVWVAVGLCDRVFIYYRALVVALRRWY